MGRPAPSQRTTRAPSRSPGAYTPRTRTDGNLRLPGGSTGTRDAATRRYGAAPGSAGSVTRDVRAPSATPTPNNRNPNRTTTTRTPLAPTTTTRRAPGERYAPTRTTTTRPTRADRPATATRTTPRDRVRGPSTTRRYAAAPTPAAGLAPRAPRIATSTAAPRLGTPLTLAPTLRAPTSGAFAGYGTAARFTGLAANRCRTNLFRGYFGGGFGNRLWWGNNCFYQPWTFGLGLGWGYSWCNPYTDWGFWNAPLSPFGAFQTSFWNSCYNDCFWTSWGRPGGVSWNFWWYPRSAYCPTYLYVPSSVVVIEEPAAEPVAAAGSVVAAARAPAAEKPADEAAGPSPTTLATKYVELGDFYFKSGRYDDAAKAYAKARNYAPDDAALHFVLADAVFANGDNHYAAFLIAEGVRLDPSLVTASTDKRLFYGEPKEFENQLDALQRHLTDKPYDAWGHLLMGYNLRFSDRPTRAIASFRRVLELDPGNATAQAFLGDLVAPAEDSGAPKDAAPAEKVS